MAATTARADSPTTEPFPALESAPRTPTSLAESHPTQAASGGAAAATTTELTTTPFRPRSSTKPDSTTASVSPRSGKPNLAFRISPAPLTGAAAMADLRKRKHQKIAEDARETSPNPAVQAMQKLMGGGGISHPSDAPATDKLSEPMQRAAEKMNIPDNASGDSFQASPVSLSSFGTIESAGATNASALTATANTSVPEQQFVAEPAQMTEGGSYPPINGNLAVEEPDGHKAFSYPGPPPQEQNQEGGPSRGMSLPGYGQSSPKSPPLSSNKRHKCPYCSTVFTRHHNLKSHLLTHSQEKPYVCQTCQARFRRLHDLKRHTKLHTGERPHTCDKCGRRFARGDALARHNKGPGGCAGRRSSFGGDDEFGPDGAGDGMDGVEYTGEEDDGSSPDQSGRRVSEPSRKRTHLETPHDPNREVYRQHSSTYPPVQGRQHSGSMGSMGPPQVVLPGSSSAASPKEIHSPAAGSSISSAYYGAPGQVFPQQGGMIESPKPLSPAHPPPHDQHRLSVGDASTTSTLHRNRSPSLTTQFQQAHFGRGSGHRTPPQPPSQFPTSHLGGPPQLPPLPSSAPQGRTGMQPGSSSLPSGPSMLHHQHMAHGSGSNPGSLSSHGRSSGSSIRDSLQNPEDIWQYVRGLEQRFSRMQDEYELRINRLMEEVMQLRGTVGVGGMGGGLAGSYSGEVPQPGRY